MPSRGSPGPGPQAPGQAPAASGPSRAARPKGVGASELRAARPYDVRGCDTCGPGAAFRGPERESPLPRWLTGEVLPAALGVPLPGEGPRGRRAGAGALALSLDPRGSRAARRGVRSSAEPAPGLGGTWVGTLRGCGPSGRPSERGNAPFTLLHRGPCRAWKPGR